MCNPSPKVFFAKSMEHKRNFKGRSLNVDEGDDPSATEVPSVITPSESKSPVESKSLQRLPPARWKGAFEAVPGRSDAASP